MKIDRSTPERTVEHPILVMAAENQAVEDADQSNRIPPQKTSSKPVIVCGDHESCDAIAIKKAGQGCYTSSCPSPRQPGRALPGHALPRRASTAPPRHAVPRLAAPYPAMTALPRPTWTGRAWPCLDSPTWPCLGPPCHSLPRHRRHRSMVGQLGQSSKSRSSIRLAHPPIRSHPQPRRRTRDHPWSSINTRQPFANRTPAKPLTTDQLATYHS